MKAKVLWLFLSVVFVYSPFIGIVNVDISHIFDTSSVAYKVFFDVRVVRVLFAFFAGAVLALSGLVFQTVFNNELLTPYTLGISSAATLGVGLAIKLGIVYTLFGFSMINIFGFAGSILSVLLVLYISRFIKDKTSLLLVGIALSFLYSATLMTVFFLGDSVTNDMLVRFTMGSLSIVGYQKLYYLMFLAVCLVLIVFMFRYELSIISVEHGFAKLKGVEVEKTIYIMLFVVSLAVGYLVSITGPVGFVGLIVPHILKKLYKQSIDRLVFKTAVFGGMFLVLCDDMARVLSFSSEFPTGIITAFLGALFFIYIVIRK